MPMDAALLAALEKKNLKALQKALESKPDLTALDRDGKTALHRVMEGKKLELAEALLAAGMPIDAKDDDGNTALHVLLKSKSGVMKPQEIANATWLVERGASLEVTGDYEYDALHFAARGAPAEVVGALLSKGAKVRRDKGGNTPLFSTMSTFCKDTATWELLLGAGCSVSDVNARGETILHRAVICHNPFAVKWFLGKGADKDVKDAEGKTARDYAVEYKNGKVLAALDKG